MKIVTVLGTRPEIIRLSIILRKLDAAADHVLVDTGQNYTASLKDVFFRELGVRKPDYSLGVQTRSMGAQVGEILSGVEAVLKKEMPDRILILGDTNSGLSAFVAKRMGIPVYHMEAGNRCYDDRVPEEVNRRVIDQCSDVLLPYTHRSAENLVREGIPRERIFVIGNPILEVLQSHESSIRRSRILKKLNVKAGSYYLVTTHRAENVDNPKRLHGIVDALRALHQRDRIPIVCSLHPRTRSQMEKLGITTTIGGIRWLEPMGLFEFVALEKSARCVLSDSGTVQEECCVFRVPTVTLRDVTERPETVEGGSNMLSGVSSDSILAAVEAVRALGTSWMIPEEYLRKDVSTAVVKILLGYRR
ncbi:UDP-N-acetylglucosamine 2-epimerase (non-hydrolysing) [Anaerolineae bacterium]|nr:UDP-N-acetylglucosamine 2-epimerase (non-hydrolysing) [Anaerolineae bacterium]